MLILTAFKFSICDLKCVILIVAVRRKFYSQAIQNCIVMISHNIGCMLSIEFQFVSWFIKPKTCIVGK